MSSINMPSSTVAYIRSLSAIRERCSKIYKLAQDDKLDYWLLHPEQEEHVVEYCANIIKRDFGTDYAKIPPHCRRNHFTTGSNNRVSTLLSDPAFPRDKQQQAKALIDLYLVSVLLDAGAGPDWSYTETDKSGNICWKGGRSEGLAVASLDMFKDGLFSAQAEDPFRVDAQAIKALTTEDLAKHLQVSDKNPMAGLDGRCKLLIGLGDALQARPDVAKGGRPGDMLDFLEPHLDTSSSPPVLPLSALWTTLFETLLPIWPSRTILESSPDEALGDVWRLPAFTRSLEETGAGRKDGDDLVPFHKLTQWLCYSLVEAIESVGGLRVDRGEGQTGLPEYRNGGLLMDLGLINLKEGALPNSAYPGGKDQPPSVEPGHPLVVEWRAITVITLDRIHQGLLKKLNTTPEELGLAQVLEAATWKGGREIAAEKRAGGGPPINIISDGTVF